MNAERIIDRDVDFYATLYDLERSTLSHFAPRDRIEQRKLVQCAEECLLALMRYRNAIDMIGAANHPTKDKPL